MTLPDVGVTGRSDGVVVLVKQLVLFSSSLPEQSVAPSHSLVMATHVPSPQANWSGAQVTATNTELLKLYNRECV